MNFVGRYYTVNGTLVAVHTRNQDHPNWPYWGHEVRLVAPFKDDRVFYWDEKGDYVGGVNVDSIVVTHPSLLGEQYLNLDHVANPQTYGAQIEVVDCEECRKERREKQGAKTSNSI